MARPEDRVGQTLLGKFEVARLIGAGGMGAVYEVQHRITGHRRALKVLHAEVGASADAVSRLVREAGVAGRVNSAYLAETFDVGVLEDGSTYLLMELLEGESLDVVLAREGALPPGRAATLAHEVATGLAEAHRAGVVHRDIKPSNVFVTREPGGADRVRILDFGIAKFLTGRVGMLTTDGSILGTPYYMSPEQAGGEPDVDARADVYAVGVLLYEMLSGRRPFTGTTPAALITSIRDGVFPTVDSVVSTPPALAAVVHRAMSRDRDARFATASELAGALTPFVERPAAPEPAPSRGRSSAWLLAALLGVGALVFVGLGVVAFALFGRPSPAPSAPRVAPPTVGPAGADTGPPELATDFPALGGDAPGPELPPGLDPAAFGPLFPPGLGDQTPRPEEQAEIEALIQLQMRGQFRECLDRALRMRPNMHVLLYRMGCAQAVGDHATARQACAELVQISPLFAESCRHLQAEPP